MPARDWPQNLWRDYLVEFPSYCSDDTPQAECHMVCSAPVTNADLKRAVRSDETGYFGVWIEEMPGHLLEQVGVVQYTTVCVVRALRVDSLNVKPLQFGQPKLSVMNWARQRANWAASTTWLTTCTK